MEQNILPKEIDEKTIQEILDKILNLNELIEIKNKIEDCSGIFTKKIVVQLLKELIVTTACYSLELYNDLISNYIEKLDQEEINFEIDQNIIS